MKREVNFRPATTADWPAMVAMLFAANLPTDGVADHLDNFLVGENDERLLCLGGFEQYGDAALLRSVVVDEALRGTGLGQRLLNRLCALAKWQGANALYLLTTTAEDYFGKRGFSAIARNVMPAALAASRELQGVCPASATLMVTQL